MSRSMERLVVMMSSCQEQATRGWVDCIITPERKTMRLHDFDIDCRAVVNVHKQTVQNQDAACPPCAKDDAPCGLLKRPAPLEELEHL